MFYLNTIEQLFLFVEQLDQLELEYKYWWYSKIYSGIQIKHLYLQVQLVRGKLKTSENVQDFFLPEVLEEVNNDEIFMIYVSRKYCITTSFSV